MKPKQIILVRHGQSESNAAKEARIPFPLCKPDYAYQLTPQGQVQAFQRGLVLSETIREAAFYVSPYWRTRQTAKEIMHSVESLKYYEDPRIREQEWGTRFESAINEGERDSYGHFYYRIRDGESCADVYDRVSDFLGTLWRDFEKPDFPENAVIVTHGMTMRVFLMRFFHLTVEEFEILKNPPNCGAYTLRLGDDGRYIMPEVEKYPQYNHPYQYAS